ncbi:MAG TPA: DUF1697 domain-containing protein [Pseudonocardia sp.]|nr:DUF1697 domain-containing protein [Pseudonocardia sp.]
MTRYVALLRGINVGGRSTIPMAELRALFADLGFGDARTYLQSGNVVFGPAHPDADEIGAEVEKAVAGRFGTDVRVLLRTADELDEVASANPFLDRQDDPTKLHVTFLAGEPTEFTVPAGPLPVPAGESGELWLRGREVYVHTPGGYGRSRIGNAFLEKALGVPATSRNWRSVLALRDLARDG